MPSTFNLVNDEPSSGLSFNLIGNPAPSLEPDKVYGQGEYGEPTVSLEQYARANPEQRKAINRGFVAMQGEYDPVQAGYDQQFADSSLMGRAVTGGLASLGAQLARNSTATRLEPGKATEISTAENRIAAAIAKPNDGLLDHAVTGAVSSLMRAGFYAPTGPIGIGASFVEDATATTYADAKQKGFTEYEASRIAMGFGALEGGIMAVFQAVGLGGLESIGKAGAWNSLKKAGTQYVAEMAEEEITAFAQAGLSKLSGLDPKALDNPGDLALQVGASTLLAMGAGHGVAKAIDFVTNPSRDNAAKAGLSHLVREKDGTEHVESIAPSAKDRRRVAEIARGIVDEATTPETAPLRRAHDLLDAIDQEDGKTLETRAIKVRTRLNNALDQLAKGEIDQAAFEDMVAGITEYANETYENKADKRASRDLERGPDYVLERLHRAKRKGELGVAEVDLAKWLIEQNPAIANDLSFGIRKKPKGDSAVMGLYASEARRAIIFKDGNAQSAMELLKLSKATKGNETITPGDQRIAHELLHHTESMLPSEVQQTIRGEWSKRLSDAIVDAANSDNTARYDALSDMLRNGIGKQNNYSRVDEAFNNGTLTQDDYQLLNPSEFWAVNAARISAHRFVNRVGIAYRLDQWLRELHQKIKGAFRLRSDSPVLAGLKAAMETDGTAISSLISDSTHAYSVGVEDSVAGMEGEPVSTDPKVEEAWQGSKARFNRSGPLTRAARAAVDAGKSLVHKYPRLSGERFGAVRDVLRVTESIGDYAHDTAANAIRRITSGLGPKRYEVFSRVLILRDLKKDVDRGLYDGPDGDKPLPFGMSRATLEADLAKFENAASRNPSIAAAIEKRQRFMTALRDELVDRQILPESVKESDDYFHHQVLDYMRGSRFSGTGIGSRKIQDAKKSFQFSRKGSDKAYNTEYLDAEFAVISQALMKIEFQNALKKLQKLTDIKGELKALHGDEWRSNIPEGHSLWQPARGNIFYPTFSISEKAMSDYLVGNKILTEEDFNKVWARGAKKAEWVIPNELATTLDNFQPREDSGVERFLGAGQGIWKRWTLFSPQRLGKYMLNNMTGDVDGVVAYNPKILTYAKQAFKDLQDFHYKGKRTPELIEALQGRVIGSGFELELADEGRSLTFNSLFKDLTGNRASLPATYWEFVRKANATREDVLRLSAYRFFKEELGKGNTRFGASNQSDIASTLSQLGPQQTAAKLAAELLGDYGNISEGGNWLRKHLIPFYAWQEINVKRYLNLIRNVAAEGEDVSAAKSRLLKGAAVKLGVKGTSLALRLGFYYAMVNAWNHFAMGDLEDQLGEEEKRQLHIILGQRSDGTIITLRAQGAFSDFMSWVGLQDSPHDIGDLLTGKKSVGDIAKEAAKAPINKIAQSVDPIKKTLLEAATGQSLFPDVFNPRPIRDKAEHIATLGLPRVWYRALVGTPNELGNPENPAQFMSRTLGSLLLYTTDPGEAAYYTARAMASDYNREVLGKDSGRFTPSDRSNALYYYKQSIRYGDDELAAEWLKKYYLLGGTPEGIKRSVANGNPLNFVNRANRKEFIESLSPEERDAFDRARKWWSRVYQDN